MKLYISVIHLVSYGVPIVIYRVSNVYLSYIYRISTVIDSGEIGFSAAKVLLFLKLCNRFGCLYCWQKCIVLIIYRLY